MSRRSRLPATGERELDRIVTALNEAGRRLSDARQQADQLARKIATGERLAAIGRVAAGVAHEIRDPIAAMRLKAENAMAGAAERKSEALSFILGQIERLDALLRRKRVSRWISSRKAGCARARQRCQMAHLCRNMRLPMQASSKSSISGLGKEQNFASMF
jgi:signal transduction histidine kinase